MSAISEPVGLGIRHTYLSVFDKKVKINVQL